MGSAFRRTAGGGVSATFQVVEVDLLRSLVLQLLELVGVDETDAAAGAPDDDPGNPFASITMDGPRERPRDPVLARLFPDAYGDDPDAAGDFRRFTERRLRTGKAGDAAALLESFEGAAVDGDRAKLRLDRDAAHAWLRTLTNLRLALGTRLGIEQDDDARWEALDEDDPRRYVRDVYDWLGWLQETLVRALGSPRR